MTRNNFSPLTKSKLALASGYRCVRPGCNQRTHFYNALEDKMVHIGAAAHDAPAANFGLRAENDLTDAQIRAYTNGAWLCRNCATFVDVIQSWFPLGTLPQWQQNASEALARQIAFPVSPLNISYTEAIARADNFLKALSKIRFEGTVDSPAVPALTKSEIDRILSLCNYLLPLNELSTLYTHTTNVQKRMLENLKNIKNEITGGLPWWYDENFATYRLADRIFLDEATKSVIDESCKRVNEWIRDYFSAYYYLGEFRNNRIDATVLYLW